VPPAERVKPLCYVNIWKARDGSFEADAFSIPDQALEEIGAGYPNVTYVGTATLPAHGTEAKFEDWRDEAHRVAQEAADEWFAYLGLKFPRRGTVD